MWNTHPLGGSIGEGKSPSSRMRWRLSRGSIDGTADISVRVYGCCGWSNTSRPDALEIIQADAFDFAPKHLPAYDVVFTDLWHDVSDGLPLYQRMKALEVPGVKYLYWIEQTLRCYLR